MQRFLFIVPDEINTFVYKSKHNPDSPTENIPYYAQKAYAIHYIYDIITSYLTITTLWAG